MKKLLAVVCGLILLGTTQVYGEDIMITEGSKVKFEYTLTVQGQVADSSEERGPLEYTHGSGMIIPGLEAQLLGLKVGDEKEIIVGPEDAYGPVNPEAIVEIPRAQMGGEIDDPQVGMVLQMQTPDGQAMNGMITEVKEETLMMNFNHPLAGQELKFNVKIVEIE